MHQKIKIGFGFDVHPLAKGLPLYLGGLAFPLAKAGAVGHSDADVLLHAICDALLGAAGLSDIGQQFPNSDESFKNISSLLLLEKVQALIDAQGYLVGNLDCSLCLEAPLINPFVPKMKTCIAKVLAIDPSDVSIKATTNEKLGFIGRGEGLAAYAVVLLYPKL